MLVLNDGLFTFFFLQLIVVAIVTLIMVDLMVEIKQDMFLGDQHFIGHFLFIT